MARRLKDLKRANYIDRKKASHGFYEGFKYLIFNDKSNGICHKKLTLNILSLKSTQP